MAWHTWHDTWLGKHYPFRSMEWLRDRLKDGFDVHHLDGDKNNNSPENLVLMECRDHMGLHGSPINRLRPSECKKLRPKKPKEWNPVPRKTVIGADGREYYS